ncbi:MAG: FecR domain-containing protein [Chitinophaga sp.]|uniref:FecR family protein n=1 Tax=Chitinophaga sp. TaxID=1869181 RepID=UPI001B0195F9|nr:FecR family protein [Chitinophaga sp.]MBO9728718.1 FecR domain-containing protein [Chitinophaga sp.]
MEDSFKYADLIVKYLREQATPAEQQELQTWLEADVRHQELMASMKDPGTLRAAMAFQDQLDVEGDWQAILARTTPLTVHRNRVWRKVAAWTAAAALLGGIIAVYTWPRSPASDPRVIADNTHTFKNDVLPGGNNATLQLGNGKKVTLGNRVTDSLKEADGTTIGQQTGELVYHKAASSDNESALFNTLSTARAGQYQLTLEDGTKVWLNAASSLKFPVHFGSGERRVELTGEGYFEVNASSARPFKVMVQGMEVLVLGTHFNIGAYGDAVKTTLVSGAVKIQLPGKRSWQLQPGQQAQVQQQQVSITTADMEKAIAWKEGIFFFKDDDFKEIMEQVARWYDLEVQYNGPMPAKRISGNINRQARLSQVLEMLNFVSGANFSINGKKVTVSTKK